jgi:hypothetical protein
LIIGAAPKTAPCPLMNGKKRHETILEQNMEKLHRRFKPFCQIVKNNHDQLNDCFLPRYNVAFEKIRSNVTEVHQ